MNKTYAIYLRVSGQDQNLDGQRQALQQWLKVQQVPRHEQVWYEEKVSSRAEKRPEYERMMQNCLVVGRHHTVICYKLDRLARRILEGIQLVVELTEAGIRVVSITQDLDFRGAQGRMLAAILFSFAELEYEYRRERQAAGISAAKKRGAFNKKGVKPANWDRCVAAREEKDERHRRQIADKLAPFCVFGNLWGPKACQAAGLPDIKWNIRYRHWLVKYYYKEIVQRKDYKYWRHYKACVDYARQTGKLPAGHDEWTKKNEAINARKTARLAAWREEHYGKKEKEKEFEEL